MPPVIRAVFDGPEGRLMKCAEHARQLGGGSPLHNLVEVKC
jgi:hypothetical protein